jgi:hypothetical protein
MVPFPMLPTESAAERRLYEGFLEQLDDAFVVYHSVDWVLGGRAGPQEGEADFVIAHPELGVLALEAKGGALGYDPATRRWTQSGRSGPHTLDKDPFTQAKGEMHSLMRILEAQDGYERWRPSLGFGVAMPDGRYEHDAHPGAPVDVVVDRDDLSRLAERVTEILRYWSRSGRRFGAEGMDALAYALGFRVEVRTPLRLRFDEEDRKIVELTQDQAWVLGFVTNRRRAAITGPAGSGKTLLATALATKVAAKGLRTLLTCRNRRLAEHLRETTAGVANLDVDHFHQLCVRIAREAGVETPAFADEPDTELFEHQLPEALAEAAVRLGPRYDAIVVDEAQDFREWWWPALLALHRDPDDGILYVFADQQQSLYGGELPIDAADRVGPLAHNIRNTKQIAEFVSVFYDGDDRPVSRGPLGRPVEVLGYRDDADLAHVLEVVLLNLLDEEGLDEGDVAIITPSGPKRSRVLSKHQVGRFRLSDRVEEGTVLATSVNAFRGLERPVVILAEVDKADERLKRYLYVGASRARNHLIVLATEDVAREIRTLAGVTAA